MAKSPNPTPSDLPAAKPLTAIDLCCGAGGWACAARHLPIRIAAAVDLDTPAVNTYRLNWPLVEVIQGDVRDTAVMKRLAALGQIDLVLGAIPCKWLSQYRVVKPVKLTERDDERKTLDAVLRLVRELNPLWWVIEDVAALIKELPTMTPYHVFNAAEWSAQRRKRVFVGDYPLPQPGGNDLLLKHVTRPGPYRISGIHGHRTVTQNRCFNRTSIYGALLDVKGPTVCNVTSGRRDAEMVIVDPSLPGGKRQMEWQEAAVLQGFPSDYVFVGNGTEVGSLVADAIQIDVGRAILTAIVRDHLARTEGGQPRRKALLPREMNDVPEPKT